MHACVCLSHGVCMLYMRACVCLSHGVCMLYMRACVCLSHGVCMLYMRACVCLSHGVCMLYVRACVCLSHGVCMYVRACVCVCVRRECKSFAPNLQLVVSIAISQVSGYLCTHVPAIERNARELQATTVQEHGRHCWKTIPS